MRVLRQVRDVIEPVLFDRRRWGGALVLAAIVALTSLPAAETGDDDSGEEPPKTALAGRVLDPEGNPVSGAAVLAVSAEAKPVQRPSGPFGGGGPMRQDHPVAESTTGEQGRFEVEVEGPAPFMLWADAEGYAPGRVDGVEAGDTPEIHLSSGWTVRGQVIDKGTGKPISGADVQALALITGGFGYEKSRERFKLETVSDDSGAFELSDLEPNFYRVVAVADGYTEDVASRLEVGLHGTPPDPVHFYLVGGTGFTGTVVSADGSPVEGARVLVRPEQNIPSQLSRWARSGGFGEKTDEEGSFTIRGVPVAPSYALQVDHDDYAQGVVGGVRVREGMVSSPLKVVLTSGTSLTARLLADGEPFAGKVSVTLEYSLPESRFSPTVRRGHDDVELKDGVLTVLRLPPGLARLTIAPEGFTDVVRDAVTLTAERPLSLGEILLESGRRITGRVLDDEGKPLAKARLEIISLGTMGLTRKTAESRPDGSFAFGGLDEMDFTVSAEADGYAPASVKDVKPDGEPIELRLQKAGSIRGRVIAGDPAKPVGGFAVVTKGKTAQDLPFQLQMVGLGESRMDFREPSGEFVVDGLAEGNYNLKFEAHGFVSSRLEKIAVSQAETTDVGDIRLERGATVHGTVREKGSGQPVGGAEIKIEEPALFNMSGFRDIGSSALMTGPDGRFSLSGLAPGRHTIRVDHERFSPRKESVEVAAGIPLADLTVELSAGGAIEGAFRDKSGNLVVGGMVMAMQGMTPDPDNMVSTDEYGHFRFENLAPGTYRIMAIADPGAVQQGGADVMGQLQMQTVEVADGKTSIVNVPPESGTITVSGTVRKGTKRIEATLFWTRMASDGATPEDFAAASSDESGSYQVRLTGPGEYRVGVQPVEKKEDWTTLGMSLKVEIPNEEQVTRDLLIPEIVLAGTVLDADTGGRLKGVQVSVIEHREDRPLAESVLAGAGETDENGSYEIDGLREDTYKIVFSKEGYGADTLGPMELEEDSKEEALDVALVPTPAVTVGVSDPEGNPVEGAFVTSLDFPILVIQGTSGQTDMNGEAVLTGLTEGVHDLGVMATGFAPAVIRDVFVPTEEDQPVRIEAARGGSLTVRVVDTEDRPVTGASVRIREADGPDLTTLLQITAIMEGRGLLTGPDGTLRIPGLESGRYEVEIRWQEIVVVETTRVQLGKENEVEITLR